MLQSKSELPIPVFIVHWNRPTECIQTVQHFLAQDIPLSIAIVDNASEPEVLKTLRDNLPSTVKIVQLEENKGWGGGLNILMNEWLTDETTPYCFISAHDALPQPGCLGMLLESMDQHPEIGIACPEYGIPQLPCFSPLRGPSLIPTTPRPPGTVESVVFPLATLMIFRKDCLKEIGLYDERYFAYGDEYDLGLRAARYHWKVGLVWGAIVINPGSWTPNPIKAYLFARNTLLLARTYGGWIPAVLRTLFMLLNTFRIWLLPSKNSAFFSELFLFARMLAIRDFLAGRYGAPPLQLGSSKS